MNPTTQQQFTTIYYDLIKYANKQFKRNVDSVDIVNDLYLYLNKNPNKVDSSKLSAFCYSYIYNQCSYTYRDKRNRYSNANTTSVEALHYLEDEVYEEEDLAPADALKLAKVNEAKNNMNSRLLTVYELYYEQNYTYVEIVDMTGISLGDVYNRINEIELFINSYVENRQQLRII